MTVISEYGHDMSGTTANRPTNCEPGMTYFDETVGRLLVYNGTSWQSTTETVRHNYLAPSDGAFWIAPYVCTVKSIKARVNVVGSDGGTVTAVVRKAPSGTAPASGTALHTGTINLKGTANANQSLTLSTTAADLVLAAGDSLCLDVTGTTTAADGVITVELMPI